jgi:hypothetical protein
VNVRKKYTLPILNLIAYIGTLVVNGLANALPLNGVTTGDLSDKYENLFVPAGITFSIWGLIYVLLGIFVVYQFVAVRRNGGAPLFVQLIGIWFLASCLANMGWIFAWHYEILPLSLFVMLLLLASLIFAYVHLEVGHAGASQEERYFVHLPFSVYLGWITIATIANVTTLLVSIGWDGFGIAGQWWAVVLIAAGVILAIAALVTRNDIFYALVVDWALVGIALKRYVVADPAAQPVLIAALAGIVVVTVGVLIPILRRRVYGPPV